MQRNFKVKTIPNKIIVSFSQKKGSFHFRIPGSNVLHLNLLQL